MTEQGAWGRVTSEQRAGMMSSETDEWATPQWLFDDLHREFGFTLDPCSTPFNRKCERFFTVAENGLAQAWAPEIVFMNPPYGRGIGAWVKKAYEESVNGATVVCLIPSRTDTAWWHTYCMRANEIRFIRGRVQFNDCGVNAPFPSCLVVFRPTPRATVIRQHKGQMELIADE